VDADVVSMISAISCHRAARGDDEVQDVGASFFLIDCAFDELRFGRGHGGHGSGAWFFFDCV